MDSRARRKRSIILITVLTAVMSTTGLIMLYNVVIPAAQASTEATGATCDFKDLIGKTADEAEATVKETGRPYRILAPGAAATMDFSADRINIQHDDNNIVVDVTCG